MREKFIIGTRGSDLALWQANFVKASLKELFPEFDLEIKVIRTTGDEVVDVALSKIGDKGLFTSSTVALDPDANPEAMIAAADQAMYARTRARR